MGENELKETAKKLYLQGVKQKRIAEQLDMSINTLKSWIKRYGWAKEKGAPEKKKSAPKIKKEVHPKNKGAPRKVTPKAVEELNANDELTDKQKLFCLYYLQSFNAAQSYIKAYGCTYETAMVEGSRALRNPKIKSELDRLRIELQSEQYFTIQDIIDDYAKQWRARITDVMTVNLTEYELKNKHGDTITDKDGNPVLAHFNEVIVKSSDQFDSSSVKEISQGKDGISVKMYDSQKAMEALVKLLPGREVDKKLQLSQAQIEMLKARTDDPEEEIEDDGFLSALESEGAVLWPEE